MCLCELVIQQLKLLKVWETMSFTGCEDPDCKYRADRFYDIPPRFDFVDYFKLR
jgi:hypothetical protein